MTSCPHYALRHVVLNRSSIHSRSKAVFPRSVALCGVVRLGEDAPIRIVLRKGAMMIGYHFELAVLSLRRNVVLTALMVVAVGVGIGTSMTMLTTLVAMSGNPIPEKSSQLFVPQIDVSGDASRHHNFNWIPRELPYRDAMVLMKAHGGVRQAAMYAVDLSVDPPQGDPFQATGRATYRDFFSMFEVPFRSGAAWGQREDDEGQNVVVLSAKLADRLFPHGDAVGRTVRLGEKDYRVIGVIRPWTPTPRFYDVTGLDAYGETEDFYLPFSTAIERQLWTSDEVGCDATALPSGWTGLLSSDCAWIEFWVELPRAAQVRAFKAYLRNYAAEQRRLGRFNWLPLVALNDVMGWMVLNRVVPNEVRVDSAIGLGFLIVCLINAIGLMLAKFSSRATELSVRRALGASRTDIFLQCVTETMVIGLSGGALGLALTAAGLSALRNLQGIASRDSALGHLISLNVEMVLITFAAAVITTICSGLYPALRASRVEPGWQLKAQ
jgi:putative ABC transport system permease protein